MINFNCENLNQFIRFGTMGDKRERNKIAEIIQNWEIVPLEKSNIERKYQETINLFISDSSINLLLTEHPHLQKDINRKLFKLLERIDSEVESKPFLLEEEELIEIFKNLCFSQHNDITNLLSKSVILLKSEIDSFKRKIDFRNEKERLKNKEFEKLHNQIVQNWEKLNKRNKPTTPIALELQKTGLKTPDKDREEKLLTDFKKISSKEFVVLWKKNNKTKDFLKDKYLKRDLDLNRYQELYKKIASLDYQIDKTKINNIKKIFEDQWEEKLSLERAHQNIKIIDETRKKALNQLYDKIEEINKLLKLLSPFIIETSSLGRLWDLSKGTWQNVDFSLLEKYAEILKKRKEIQELSELLGKYRKLENDILEEDFENIELSKNYRIEHSGKSELIGITESDDLNNVLPTELSLFSEIETENIFYRKFIEKKLQTYQFISKENDYTEKRTKEKRNISVETDKGPFIIAIDTSGSMHGEPEFLAKVICFTITKIAIKEQRKAFLISFSTGVEMFEMTDIQNSIPKLIEFLQMSFYGGTDASEAVKLAIEQMKSKAYKKADLLIISDGIFSALDSETRDKITILKKEGNAFNSLIIGDSYNERALQFCNNLWQYDPNYDSLKDLVRKIKSEPQ